MRSFRITGSSEGLVVHVSLSRRPARQIERHLGTMPRLRRLPVASHLDELTSAQSGAVSRSQLLALGMSDDQIRRQLRRRWQQSGLPGVYLTFSGPIDFATRSWVAVLYAGAGATLALDAAAFLWGLRKDAPEAITVMVPADRRVVPQPFLDIRLRVHLAERRHPVRRPPVTTLEDTVLDLVEATASGRQAVGVIILACQQRLTTPARLLDAASRRKKMRRRALVADVLAEVRSGVQSPLERQYYWQVERAHGLPKGRRNQAEGRRGRRRYRDVRYQGLRTVVELDGRLAHPGEERDRDDIRDNEVAETEGTVTLRYGWAAVADDPCGIAAQVGRVLASRGWSGRIKPCGPQCTASLP